jgi:hypothetical protein
MTLNMLVLLALDVHSLANGLVVMPVEEQEIIVMKVNAI